MFKPLLVSMILIGLAACAPVRPVIDAPQGHPANPYSRSGKPLAVPGSLQSGQDETDPVDITNKKTPVPASGGSVDHSGHNMTGR